MNKKGLLSFCPWEQSILVSRKEKAALISTKNAIFLTAPTADSVANQEVLPINDPAPAKPTPLLHFSFFLFHQRRRSCEISLRTTVPSASCCCAKIHRTPLCVTVEVSACWKVPRWPVVLINRRLASTGFHIVNPGALDVVHLQHWLL